MSKNKSRIINVFSCLVLSILFNYSNAMACKCYCGGGPQTRPEYEVYTGERSYTDCMSHCANAGGIMRRCI